MKKCLYRLIAVSLCGTLLTTPLSTAPCWASEKHSYSPAEFGSSALLQLSFASGLIDPPVTGRIVGLVSRHLPPARAKSLVVATALVGALFVPHRAFPQGTILPALPQISAARPILMSPRVTPLPTLPYHYRIQWEAPYPSSVPDDYEVIIERVDRRNGAQTEYARVRLFSQASRLKRPSFFVSSLEGDERFDMRSPHMEIRLPNEPGTQWAIRVAGVSLTTAMPSPLRESPRTIVTLQTTDRPNDMPSASRLGNAIDRNFVPSERSRLDAVLSRYLRVTSPRLLRTLNLTFSRLPYPEDALDTLPADRDPRDFGDTPASQFSEIRLAPAAYIEGYAARARRAGDVRAGEEGWRHDFEWTTAHELGHAIFMNLYGYEAFHPESQPAGPLRDWMTKWVRLDNQIRESTLLAARSRPIGNQRPLGYPNLRAFEVGPHETLADTMAYVINETHYADSDRVFMQRVGLMKEFITLLVRLDRQGYRWRLMPPDLNDAQTDWVEIRLKQFPREAQAAPSQNAVAVFSGLASKLATSDIEQLLFYAETRDGRYLPRWRELVGPTAFFSNERRFLNSADFVADNRGDDRITLYHQARILESILAARRQAFHRPYRTHQPKTSAQLHHAA